MPRGRIPTCRDAAPFPPRKTGLLSLSPACSSALENACVVRRSNASRRDLLLAKVRVNTQAIIHYGEYSHLLEGPLCELNRPFDCSFGSALTGTCVPTVSKAVLVKGYQMPAADSKALPVGSFYTERARVPHFVATPDGETVVQITGTGPTKVDYVDAAHAPKKQTMATWPSRGRSLAPLSSRRRSAVTPPGKSAPPLSGTPETSPSSPPPRRSSRL